MNNNSLWFSQVGVYAQLASYGPLTSLLAEGSNSVFDYAPTGAVFPYITIGEAMWRFTGSLGLDHIEVIISVHVYSRDQGFKQVKEIMERISEALHFQQFDIDKHNLVMCRSMGDEVKLDSDGVTRQGIQKYQLILEFA